MVKNLVMTSVTNKEGKLSLSDLDIGPAERRVRVSILVEDLSNVPASEGGTPASPADLAEWNRFVERTEGQIDDPTFTRHNQGIVRTVASFDGDE